MEVNAAADPPFRLITLGRIALETPTGEDADLARRRRKLALLAVLALSADAPSREMLAEMFWGDEDPERARHSLSDALSSLRRVLGRDAISGRSELVQLNARGLLQVDAIELERAFEAGDHTRVRALYGGPFLDGLSVEGSEPYATWVVAMRERYASLFARAEAASVPAAVAPRVNRRTTTLLLAGGAAALAAATIVGMIIANSARATPAHAGPTPVVALTDVRTDPADTSLVWLRDGLQQMIAADLGRVSTVEVISPASVREAAPRTGDDSLGGDRSIELARRLHADWAASATVARRAGAYLVAVTLRDVAHKSATRRYEVSGPNILTVADAAAAKMLTTLDVGGKGPHLSEVETANTDAYRHFIRSEEFQSDSKIPEAARELDAAIAVDSGFTSAILARIHLDDGGSRVRFRPLLDRARARMTEWDRLSEMIYDADHSGDPLRAESLGRQLVARYPRDPRALRVLADIYTTHAAYAKAESLFVRLITLDEPTDQRVGPCWACDGYAGLINVRHLAGNYPGEIDAARRFTVLRPASGGTWLSLANALVLNGEPAASEAAYARYRQLVGERAFDPFTGRMLVTGRRLDEAEAYARRFLTSEWKDDAYDLLNMVLRERGQFRATAKLMAAHQSVANQGVNLVYGHTLGALGEESHARSVFERNVWHPPALAPTAAEYGNDARGFTWHHTLEADAIWERADTSVLASVADSVRHIGKWSYYARDWTAFHHIRGLLAERAGDLVAARGEFEQALSAVRGFTRSNVELARVNMALGKPAQAITTLRAAYREPLDAMGRYAARSELDFQMAKAFQGAGQLDSARVYASYVRAAWVRGDPSFQARLTQLP